MKLLPPPGPERWRALAVLFAVVVLAVYFVPGLFSSDPPPPTRPTGPNATPAAAPASSSSTRAASGKKAVPETPVPLELAALDSADGPAPETGRNPFRFGEPPKPPAPPPQPMPVYVAPLPQPPPPPPAPQVKLSLLLTMISPETGKWVANFRDDKGIQFTGADGEIIDGRYKLIRVGEKSAVVSFLDGTGQRTLVEGR